MNETSTEHTNIDSSASDTSVGTPTPAYNGWLVSNDLIKRSVAVFMHSLLGQLIIVVPLMILFYIIAFIVVGINI